MDQDSIPKKRHKKLLSIVLVFFLLIVVIIGLAIIATHQKSSIPKSVKKQVSFVIYVPTRPWTLEPKDVTYIKSSSVLSLVADNSNFSLTITEQAAPSQFTDIPQYYPALLTKLNEYESFGSVNGTTYLTKPTELNGGVEALMDSDGTLMFVHPNKNLSDNQWRSFFNQLQIIK